MTTKRHLTKYKTEKRAADNTGLAKVAVQCSADTFVVNKSLVLRIIFMVKIATFAKPETVMRHFKKTIQREKNEKP
jgi:hypothetical protein